MRSSWILVTVLAAAVSASRCGGGNSSSSNQTPTSPGTTTPTVVTVSIVGTKGNASYVPDPVPTSATRLPRKSSRPMTDAKNSLVRKWRG